MRVYLSPIEITRLKRKERKMSIGYEKIKIGIEVGGERKYLSEVEIKDGKASYQLSEQGDVWGNPEGYNIAKELSKIETDKTFLILNGE